MTAREKELLMSNTIPGLTILPFIWIKYRFGVHDLAPEVFLLKILVKKLTCVKY